MESDKVKIFFDILNQRRSIRRFKEQTFPDAYIEKSLQAATLAPNSSNVQAWDFYWVKNPQIKKSLVEACFNQSAARTANQLVVVTASGQLWRRSQKPLIEWVKAAKAPDGVLFYYQKLIPFTYTSGFFNILAPLKMLLSFLVGLFRPMARGPHSARDIQEVVVKSAALAAENFVLSITAHGGASCMMEGFDEVRLKKALALKGHQKVVMVIGVGYEAEKGTWGERFRLPQSEVVHIIE